MTKKEKIDEAKRLKAEIDARNPKPPKKELTEDERREQRRWEIRARDRAKNAIDPFTGHVIDRNAIEKWKDALMNKW